MTPMASRKEHRDATDGTQPGGSVVPDVAKRMDILNPDRFPEFPICFFTEHTLLGYFAHGTPLISRKLSLHPYCSIRITVTVKTRTNHINPRVSAKCMKNKTASPASTQATTSKRTNICVPSIFSVPITKAIPPNPLTHT